MDENESSAVTAVVKWFNPHKRYGFVHIPERNQDAFMHASVLEADGEWPREDDTIKCTLDEDGRGLKVAQVLEVSRAEGLPRAHGAVRWFDRRKGYGFVVTETEEDIFVHRSALGEMDEEAMRPGRFVTFRAREGRKGMAAADVELSETPPADVAGRIQARLDLDEVDEGPAAARPAPAAPDPGDAPQPDTDDAPPPEPTEAAAADEPPPAPGEEAQPETAVAEEETEKS